MFITPTMSTHFSLAVRQNELKLLEALDNMICLHFTDFIRLYSFKIQLKMYFHSLAFDFGKEHEWRKVQVLMANDSLSFLLFLETWAKNGILLSFAWLLSILKYSDDPMYKHKGKEGYI